MSHTVRYTFQFFTELIGVHEALVPAIQARIDLDTDAPEVMLELVQIRDALQQVIDDYHAEHQEP